MEQHTPAPWQAKGLENHAIAIEGPKYEWPGQEPHAVRRAAARTVAVVRKGDGGSYTFYPDETARANATLIAAAPRLLAALEQLLNSGIDTDDIYDDPDSATLAAIREGINAAREARGQEAVIYEPAKGVQP